MWKCSDKWKELSTQCKQKQYKLTDNGVARIISLFFLKTRIEWNILQAISSVQLRADKIIIDGNLSQCIGNKK